MAAGPSRACLELTSLLASHLDGGRDHVPLAPVEPRGCGDPEGLTNLPHARDARGRCVWCWGLVRLGFRHQVPFQLWGSGTLGPWGKVAGPTSLAFDFSPWTTLLICQGERTTHL